MGQKISKGLLRGIILVLFNFYLIYIKHGHGHEKKILYRLY